MMSNYSARRDRDFNPRTPVRGATSAPRFTPPMVEISIHAPLCGVRPLTRPPQSWCYVISIHAPLCGVRHNHQHDDKAHNLQISIHAPLCGVRLGWNGKNNCLTQISIHAPLCGVRPDYAYDLLVNVEISIHAPLCGVRHLRKVIFTASLSFQSTHPCAGCDLRHDL